MIDPSRRSPIERGVDALLDRLFADAGDGRLTDLDRVRNRLVGPAWSSGTPIRFEQNARVHQLARRGRACGNQVLEGGAFVAAELDGIVLILTSTLSPHSLPAKSRVTEYYVRTARAKGVVERRVLLVHAFRNALIPLVTVIGLRLGFLVGGAVLAETVFAYPGVGRLIFRSVQQHDYPVLQGAFLMLAITVVLFNLITDLLYGFLDPRIRYGR